jgi:hypothetical protein
MEKTIRKFNYYNNGTESKVNVYFTDGTEWHRTIQAREVVELAHCGEEYLKDLFAKYREPQPKSEPQRLYIGMRRKFYDLTFPPFF